MYVIVIKSQWWLVVFSSFFERRISTVCMLGSRLNNIFPELAQLLIIFRLLLSSNISTICQEFKRLSVLYLNFGNIIAFLTGIHWTANWELKISNFILKLDTSLSSGKINGMTAIFFCSKIYLWRTITILELYWLYVMFFSCLVNKPRTFLYLISVL